MSATQQAAAALPKLHAAMAAGDFGAAQTELTKLKILVTDFPSQAAAGFAPSQEETALARAIFEAAVLLSVRMGDDKSFSRHFAMLKPYYHTSFAESAEARDARLTAYGLYLLWLLCESRLADFHAVVELLSAEDRASAYVAFSLRLEAFMMEGSYNKVLAARGVVPSQTYLPFLSKLEGTVREEVADCIEQAYPKLAVEAAGKMLMLDSAQAVMQFVATSRPTWNVNGGVITFPAVSGASSGSKPATGAPLDAATLIEQALHYANEIERIV